MAKVTKKNYMGGNSYELTNPLGRLRLMAASSFFGEPTYYVDGSFKSRSGKVNANSRISDTQAQYLMDVLKGIVEPASATSTTADRMEKVIDEALNFDLEGTLQIAAELRNEDNIRTTPQVILVRAANHKDSKGTGLIRKYAKDILRRTDEASVQLAYQLLRFSKTVPNSLKRVWNDHLSNCSEYSLAKYRMEMKQVKTIDVVRFCHANSPAIDKLVKGTLTNEQNTWESFISANGSTQENWTRAIDKMGHMSLLRNLNNLLQNNVCPKLFTDKLISGVKDGKQLPFRYYTAYETVKSRGHRNTGAVTDALETCLHESIKDAPKFKGKVAALTDNSGSAHSTFTSDRGRLCVSEIGNLTSILTGMLAEGDSYVIPFGNTIKTIKVDKNKSIFSQLDEVRVEGHKVGSSTEGGIWEFWKNAIEKKEHWDHVVVYSDMQAGHGGLFTAGSLPDAFKWDKSNFSSTCYIDVAALINKYREVVNPDVHVFLVQTAGYSDTIIPEFYDKTYILGGWSAGIFNFMHRMIKLNP